MHTCIHALHTLHTYIYTHTHCPCMKSGHVTRCIICFWWVGNAVRWQAYPFSWPQLRAKCTTGDKQGSTATADQLTTGDKQGSTATADQLRRKTQPQLRTSVDARKANHRNCGELSATAHYCSLVASVASCLPTFLGTAAYIVGECCQREVGSIMLFSFPPPYRCVQSFSLTLKPIL